MFGMLQGPVFQIHRNRAEELHQYLTHSDPDREWVIVDARERNQLDEAWLLALSGAEIIMADHLVLVSCRRRQRRELTVRYPSASLVRSLLEASHLNEPFVRSDPSLVIQAYIAELHWGARADHRHP